MKKLGASAIVIPFGGSKKVYLARLAGRRWIWIGGEEVQDPHRVQGTIPTRRDLLPRARGDFGLKSLSLEINICSARELAVGGMKRAIVRTGDPMVLGSNKGDL